MAVSQNGWGVLSVPPTGTSQWITGRVRNGDVKVVLDYVASRWNAEVERIRKDWSWGWANRAIRGATTTSNHASGTAYDINAPMHPLGVSNTFSPKQLERLRAIERDCDGVVRFGQFYNGRKDGMHIEINANGAAVKRLADRIRAGQARKPGNYRVIKVRWVAVNMAILRQQFRIAMGQKKGKIFASNDVARIQAALNNEYDFRLTVDGLAGPKTLEAWAKHERKVGGVGPVRLPDKKSLDALAKGRFKWYWPDQVRKGS